MSINTPSNGPLAASQARPTGRKTIQHAVKFDYLPTLNTEQSEQLFQITQNIKRNQRTAITAIIEAGQELRNVKKLLDHGDFGLWLEREFAMSERTAQNMMSVADRFESATVADLPINIGALYELAAPSTPDDVIEDVIERAEAGEHITRDDVRVARQHERTFTTRDGFVITQTWTPGNTTYTTLTTPDGQVFEDNLFSRVGSFRLVRSHYQAWLDEQQSAPIDLIDPTTAEVTQAEPGQGDQPDDDLPDEPISDLIFAILDDGERHTFREIRDHVKQSVTDATSYQVGEALKPMVAEGDVVKHVSNAPGEIATYSLNGHTEVSGQRSPTLQDDRNAILAVLDKRRRDAFYLGQLNRWSNIFDFERTRAAVDALPEVLREDCDNNDRTIYRRVDATPLPKIVDASLPTADEVHALISQHDDVMLVDDIVANFEGMTPADLGELLNIIHADPRLKLGARHVYTDAHPQFDDLSPELPAADGTPPEPVKINGQQALTDDLKEIKSAQAVKTLSTLADLLYAVELAIAAVETANLSDLRFVNDTQAATLNQRLEQYVQHLDTHRGRMARLTERYRLDQEVLTAIETTYQETKTDLEAQANV